MPTTTKHMDDEMAELRAKVDKLTGDVAGLTKSLADVLKSRAGRAADEVHEGAKTTTGGISEKAKDAEGAIAWHAFAWDELARLLNETFARTNYQWKKHDDDFVEWWDGFPHIAPQSEAPSEIVYWLGVLNAESGQGRAGAVAPATAIQSNTEATPDRDRPPSGGSRGRRRNARSTAIAGCSFVIQGRLRGMRGIARLENGGERQAFPPRGE